MQIAVCQIFVINNLTVRAKGAKTSAKGNMNIKAKVLFHCKWQLIGIGIVELERFEGAC
jgi:hypothetical protein